MEQLKKMKECLTDIVEGQVCGNLEKVDTHELGAAIDMIKDLSEALYYCAITEAMEESDEKEEHENGKYRMRYMPRDKVMYNYPIEMYDPRYRDKYEYPIMYNDGKSRNGHDGGHVNESNDGYRYHRELMPMERPYYPMHEDEMRDPREGKSGHHRKMYMEGKGMKDKTHQMKELENYMQELTTDLTEMIQDASPEEKQLLQQKISTLATKIK